MEHTPGWLSSTLIYLGAAVFAVPLSKYLGLGAIIGYLGAGIAIGPWGLGLVTHVEDILHFAEFGVVLMIGGNIPGVTRVVSTQIYGHVEAMEYTQAHWLAGGMLVFSFVVLLGLALLNRRNPRVLP